MAWRHLSGAPRLRTGLLCTLTLTLLLGAVALPEFSLDIATDDGTRGHEASLPELCEAASSRPLKWVYPQQPRPHCSNPDPGRRLDIVLSHAKEESYDLKASIAMLLAVPSFRSADACLFLGSKILNASAFLSVDGSHYAPGIDMVFELSNVGREWTVYFTYMIAFYANLPAHVAFMHARPNSLPENLPRLELFVPATGMLAIALWGQSGCHHPADFPAPTSRILELWSMFRHSFCPKHYHTIMNGHAIISRRRILQNPIDHYRTLYRFAAHHQAHHLAHDAFVQRRANPGFNVNWEEQLSRCDSLFSGHVLERAWSFLFNCYQEPNRVACNEALPLNPTCAYAGVQCYDEIPPFPWRTKLLQGGQPVLHVP